MQKYTKLYLDGYGKDETDFIGCAVCNKKATEIHHIISRGKQKSWLMKLENLMPICRTCHNEYGDRKEYMELLLKINWKIMKINRLKIDEKFFTNLIRIYTN